MLLQKNNDTFIQQIKTRTQETSELKLQRSKLTVSFNTLLELDEDIWITEVIVLEINVSTFNITEKTKHLTSLSSGFYYNITNINKLEDLTAGKNQK